MLARRVIAIAFFVLGALPIGKGLLYVAIGLSMPEIFLTALIFGLVFICIGLVPIGIGAFVWWRIL